MKRAILPLIALLAGGRGTRLGAETAHRPKALVDVGGRPFIERQLDLLRQSGFKRVVVLAGHLGEQIERRLGSGHSLGLEIRYHFDGPLPAGTGGAIADALAQLGETFGVLYGDSYLDVDYQAVLRSFRPAFPALMTVCKAAPDEAGNVTVADERVRAYVRPPAPNLRFMDYGLSFFRRVAFKTVPPSRPYDLGNLFADLAARQSLQACLVPERFEEIGSPEGLRRLRQKFQLPG